MHTRSSSYLELIRAPAMLTVLGDSLVGSSAAGHGFTLRRLALPLASACLYSAGMALNDYADRKLDAQERPERPIPSGRITPSQALVAASSLTVAGLALAAGAGGRSTFRLALPLAGCIWIYDLVAKPHAIAGPLFMGACRSIDVLMGAGTDRATAAIVPAAVLGAHTVGVTVLARGEVNGTTRAIASGVAGSTALLCSAISWWSTRQEPRRYEAFFASAFFLSRCLPAQLRTAHTPSATNALEATRSGIRAMVPLQAALSLRHGNIGAGLALGIVDLAGKAMRSRRNVRKISES